MTREEAEAMYRLGPEAVVEAPMELGRQVDESKEAVARLSRDSANSSKPPSSDGPGVKREKKRKGGSGKRKPGGRKGREGHGRALSPAEEMDRVREIFPDVCEACGKALDAGECEEVGEPVGHRVFEPPRAEPIETEYRRLRHRDGEDPEARTRARRTLASRDRLFAFPGREGVEPVNNEAERASRPAVQPFGEFAMPFLNGYAENRPFTRKRWNNHG